VHARVSFYNLGDAARDDVARAFEVMLQRTEMDARVGLADQLATEVGPVVRNAFADPAFQATFARYPDSTVASPHLFQKVAVSGICVDR
jgi:hypothetical protein